MKFLASVLLAASALLAQAQSPAPAFEVAAVKLSAPDCLQSEASGSMRVDQARFIARCEALKTLIFWAYNVKEDQVAGPEWLDDVDVDVEAKLPDGSTEDQARAMLQALLADRFKMTARRANREQSVYALVVAKGGLKIKAQDPVPAPEPAPGAESTTVGLPGSELRITQTAKGGSLSGKGFTMTRDQNGAHIEMSQMGILAGFLPEFVGRPVVDKTNLTGNYAIRIDFSMDQMMQARQSAASDPESGAALFLDAVEKLGPRLESQKAQIETVVVEHIERTPGEN